MINESNAFAEIAVVRTDGRAAMIKPWRFKSAT
jgi:hypothetical protein